MYLTIRALHVLCGALWAGISVASVMWLMPLMADLGPHAEQAGNSLQRRGFHVVFPILAFTTILSGIWLYWRYTGGFSPEVTRTTAAMVFGTGGALGILALLLGALVIGRNMAKARTMMEQAASSNENDRRRLIGAARLHQQRSNAAGRIVAALLVITIVLMAIGHYV
jgi:hypothetical protein